MNILFTSDGCPGCTAIKNFVYMEKLSGHLKMVDVKFNHEYGYNVGYLDGKEVEGECPVSAVPALYQADEGAILYGYDEIKRVLKHGNK